MRTLCKWIVLVAVIGWAALYYSKSGVLVSGRSKTFTAQGSEKQSQFLVCKYFTGMGFVIKDFWNADTAKNERCPLVVRLN